jgi:hypothetical protein
MLSLRHSLLKFLGMIFLFKLGNPPIGTQIYATDLARKLRELDFRYSLASVTPTWIPHSLSGLTPFWVRTICFGPIGAGLVL